MGLFKGESPTYDIMKIPGTASMKPPMFDFAKFMGQYLKSLVGAEYPTYQGSLDPGMSPTMQMMGNLSQMYGNSPLPAVFGQAMGSLSRFTNPSFTNPQARMEYGAPNYFGNQYESDQFLPGGGQLGQQPYGGGMRPFSGFTPGGGGMQPSLPQQPYGVPGVPGPRNAPGGEGLAKILAMLQNSGGMQPTIPNEGGQIGPMGMPGKMEDQSPFKYGQTAY